MSSTTNTSTDRKAAEAEKERKQTEQSTAALTAAVVASLLLSTAPSVGQGFTMSTDCIRGYRSCTTSFQFYPRTSSGFQMTEEDRAAAEERTRLWIERCKPVESSPDKYGMIHYIYAASGCQFGQYKD